MSRKRSHAHIPPHGPRPLVEQVPLYARNPRGLFRPVESRGAWRPVWKTPSFRTGLVVLLGAPLVMLALVILLVAIQAIFSH
jgi:hypothetical protein